MANVIVSGNEASQNKKFLNFLTKGYEEYKDKPSDLVNKLEQALPKLEECRGKKDVREFYDTLIGLGLPHHITAGIALYLMPGKVCPGEAATLTEQTEAARKIQEAEKRRKQVAATTPASKNIRRVSRRRQSTQKPQKVYRGKRGGLYVIKYRTNKFTGRRTAYKRYLD